LSSRDLFGGPGGTAVRPDPGLAYVFVADKTTGKNPRYEVRDPIGRLWSVKLGEEAQPEVVTSRLLWAIGYYQAPTYHLHEWKLMGAKAGGPQLEGRFRLEQEGHEVVGEWSWYENPFIASRAFRGLIVAQLLVNNWDWKPSNNKIYRVADASGSREVYMVRDLGASLGKASQSPFFKWLNIRHLQGIQEQPFPL
jgi:hypothetical protein